MCGTQKTQIEQSEERRAKLKHHAPWLQTTPQSHGSQKCMLGSIPGWGTKVPEAVWQKRKKKVYGTGTETYT